MLNSLLLRYPMPTFRKQIKSSTVNYDFRFQLDGNDKSKGEKQHDNENKGHMFKLIGFSLLAKKEQ